MIGDRDRPIGEAALADALREALDNVRVHLGPRTERQLIAELAEQLEPRHWRHQPPGTRAVDIAGRDTDDATDRRVHTLTRQAATDLLAATRLDACGRLDVDQLVSKARFLAGLIGNQPTEGT